MDEIHEALSEYEKRTIVLRVDEEETKALLEILIFCELSHPQKRWAVLLGDRLAYEMDAFKWRRAKK